MTPQFCTLGTVALNSVHSEPVPTISHELPGGTKVTSTMNSYQHPERVAAVVAVILPLIYEISRRRQQAGYFHTLQDKRKPKALVQ
jgi:hypothetical protein